MVRKPGAHNERRGSRVKCTKVARSFWQEIALGSLHNQQSRLVTTAITIDINYMWLFNIVDAGTGMRGFVKKHILCQIFERMFANICSVQTHAIWPAAVFFA